MSRKPHIPLRKIAELAVDYETTGGPMRDVAERQDVSAATVYRAVREEREAMADLETRHEGRRFDLQRHVADVLIESAELQRKALGIVNRRVDDADWAEKQSGRDWAALVGTLMKENRAWFDYMRRTFGDRQNEPRADLPEGEVEPDTHE